MQLVHKRVEKILCPWKCAISGLYARGPYTLFVHRSMLDIVRTQKGACLICTKDGADHLCTGWCYISFVHGLCSLSSVLVQLVRKDSCAILWQV